MGFMTHARIAMFTIDCSDPAREAEFWSALTGGTIAVSTEDYAMVTGEGPALGFGRIDDYAPSAWPDTSGAKQFHLDLAVADLDEAQARAVELGATVADPQPGETWRVLLDPAGHPFCLTDVKNWG